VTRYVRNPAVRETVLEAEIFLVDGTGREVFYLDAVTSGLWRLLEAPQTIASCMAVFVAAFPDASAERLAQDLAKALADFEAQGLVLRVS
jgi:hypothetical protein